MWHTVLKYFNQLKKKTKSGNVLKNCDCSEIKSFDRRKKLSAIIVEQNLMNIVSQFHKNH